MKKKTKKIYWAVVWKNESAIGDLYEDLEGGYIDDPLVQVYRFRGMALEWVKQSKPGRGKNGYKVVPVYITKVFK